MSMVISVIYVLYLWLIFCPNNRAVESSRHLICHLSTFALVPHTACVLKCLLSNGTVYN